MSKRFDVPVLGSGSANLVDVYGVEPLVFDLRSIGIVTVGLLRWLRNRDCVLILGIKR
jgi:hypothetical protein